MYRWQMELDSISRLHVMRSWKVELYGCRKYIKGLHGMPGWNKELYGCREYIKHL